MYLSMVIIDLSIEDIDNLYPFTAVKLKLKENVEMYVNINFYTLTIENTPCRPDHWLPCSSPHICSNKSAIWCNTQPWFVWTQDVSAIVDIVWIMQQSAHWIHLNILHSNTLCLTEARSPPLFLRPPRVLFSPAAEMLLLRLETNTH